EGSASDTLTIARAAAVVTLDASGLNQTYDGSPKFVSVVTTPANLSTSVTYKQNGAVVIQPTNVGSYSVTATVSDPNYDGTASGTLIISSGAANVVLVGSSLNQTYDGTPKLITAVTTTPGLSVSITYSGSSTAPIDAGAYDVVITITDPNYQGTAS